MHQAIRRICGGLCEYESQLPTAYRQAILTAGRFVGSQYASEQERLKLVQAVKLNLISRKQYSYEFLQRRYGLPVSKGTFFKEQNIFCRHLAEELQIL